MPGTYNTMKYPSILALGVLTLGLLPAYAQTETAAEFEFQPLERVESEELSPGAGAGDEVGKFKFVLSFEPADTREESLIRTTIERGGEMAQILDELSAQIALPQDVPVRFADCGEANAYWDYATQDVTICYEFLSLFNESYQGLENQFKAVFSWADQIEVLMGTTTFVLLHEIGHGMVDIFDLPITGREEDSVDQFATYVLINSDEEGDKIEERPSRYALLAGYLFEQLKPVGTVVSRQGWADVHTIGAQRNIDLMCLVLGSNPEVYSDLVVPGLMMVDAFYAENREIVGGRGHEWLDQTDDLNLIPWRRAVSCGHEYAKYDASWDYITETFMTPQAN